MPVITTVQPSFSSGEVSPELHGRTDQTLYYTGLKTARNMVVNGTGGIYNRSGLRFVSRIKNQQQGARLFSFKFSVGDTYVLEMGHRYVRFIRNDQHVVDEGSSVNLSSLKINNSNGKLICTVSSHSFVTGDDVFVFGVPGVPVVNGRMFRVWRISNTQFELLNQADTTSINARSYSGLPATGGGEVVKVYELETPYNFEDLNGLRYSQVGDVITFTKAGRNIRELKRTDHDSWTITVPNIGVEKKSIVVVDDSDDRSDRQRLYKLSLGITRETDVNAVLSNSDILSSVSYTFPSGTTGALNEVDVIVLYDKHINPRNNNLSEIRSVSTGAPFIDSPSLPGFSVVGYEIDRIYKDNDNKINIVWSTNGLVNVGIPSSSLTEGSISDIDSTSIGHFASYLDGGTLSFPGLRNGDPICLHGFTYQGDQSAAFFDRLHHCNYAILSINQSTRTIKLDLEVLGDNADLSLLGVSNAKIYIPFLRIPYTPRNSTDAKIVITPLPVRRSSSRQTGFRFYARPKGATNFRLVGIHISTAGSAFGNQIGGVILGNIRADNSAYASSGADSGDIAPLLKVDVVAAGSGATNEHLNTVGFAPNAVGFYKQRRVFGGSKDSPDKLFYSEIGDYYNFDDLTKSKPLAVGEVLNADDPFSATLAANTVDTIQHIVPLDELLVLTDNLQWQIQPVSGAAFSLITADHRPRQYIGAADIPPLVLDDTVIFVRNDSKEVIGLGYSNDREGYIPIDLSLLSKHLFKDTLITDMTFIYDIFAQLAFVKGNGEVAWLALNFLQKLIGWTRWDTNNGSFESAQVGRSGLSVSSDVCYFVVKRTVNGKVHRFIERTTQRVFTDIRDGYFVDSGLTYDNPMVIETISTGTGTTISTKVNHGLSIGDEVIFSDILWASDVDDSYTETQPDQLNNRKYKVGAVPSSTTFTITAEDENTAVYVEVNSWKYNSYVEGGKVRKTVNTLYGLSHLEGEEVVILADGNVIDGVRVGVGGKVVLPEQQRAGRVHIGLRYVSEIETLNVETPIGGNSTTSQNVLKSVSEIWIGLHKSSRGVLYRVSGEDRFQGFPARSVETPAGQPEALFTGDVMLTPTAIWDRSMRVTLRQKGPLPLELLAIKPEFEVQEDRD